MQGEGRTDSDTRDDLAPAAIEVEQHAHVVLLVDRLLEDVLREPTPELLCKLRGLQPGRRVR